LDGRVDYSTSPTLSYHTLPAMFSSTLRVVVLVLAAAVCCVGSVVHAASLPSILGSVRQPAVLQALSAASADEARFLAANPSLAADVVGASDGLDIGLDITVCVDIAPQSENQTCATSDLIMGFLLPTVPVSVVSGQCVCPKIPSDGTDPKDPQCFELDISGKSLDVSVFSGFSCDKKNLESSYSIPGCKSGSYIDEDGVSLCLDLAHDESFEMLQLEVYLDSSCSSGGDVPLDASVGFVAGVCQVLDETVSYRIDLTDGGADFSVFADDTCGVSLTDLHMDYGSCNHVGEGAEAISVNAHKGCYPDGCPSDIPWLWIGIGAGAFALVVVAICIFKSRRSDSSLADPAYSQLQN
jgi:hypothetical protein